MTLVGLGSRDPDQNYVGTDPAEVDYEVGWLAAQVSELPSGDFVNMSFGISGLTENYLNESFGPSYAPAIRSLAQPDAAGGRKILVLAAGNDHGHRCEAPEPNCVQGEIDASSPGLFAGLPAREASLRGHVVAVVATGPRGGHRGVFQPLRDCREMVHRRAGRHGAGGRDPHGPGYGPERRAATPKCPGPPSPRRT